MTGCLVSVSSQLLGMEAAWDTGKVKGREAGHHVYSALGFSAKVWEFQIDMGLDLVWTTSCRMTLGESFSLLRALDHLSRKQRCYTQWSVGIQRGLVPGPRPLQIPKSPGVQVPLGVLVLGMRDPLTQRADCTFLLAGILKIKWNKEHAALRRVPATRWDLHQCEFTHWFLDEGSGQGSLACCSPWGRQESDTTEQLNWTEWVWCRLRVN